MRSVCLDAVYLATNPCRRGLPNNQLSLKFCIIILNYIYMISVQKKAIDMVPIPSNKGFHAGAEAQTIALELNDAHSSYLSSRNHVE